MIDKEQFLTIDDMIFGTQKKRSPAQIKKDTERMIQFINEYKKKQKASKVTTRKKKAAKAK